MSRIEPWVDGFKTYVTNLGTRTRTLLNGKGPKSTNAPVA